MPASQRISDVRFIGAMVGRYALDSRRDADSEVQKVFACRLQSISARHVVASAPVVGRVGEGVSLHFEPFGPLRGLVDRHIEDGFTLELECSDEEREKLASRIEWYKKRTFAGITDKRSHKRFMPREPRSAVVLADGTMLPCLVIDVSVSGAAVSADADPPIGAPLAIGKLVARVVRRLEVGFAVRFIEPQDLARMEELLRPVSS